jgi:peptidoglycan/xylan/chitin deacetylase (PgdA/CDA1 family)
MAFTSLIMRRASSAAWVFLSFFCFVGVARAGCSGSVYLTIDTGSMSQAENIAAILNKHQVKATFFLSNEKTVRGDYSLDASWGDYWRARVKEGHAFGSHTWRHWYFQRDLKEGTIFYRAMDGSDHTRLTQPDFCAELKHSGEVFEKMTGRKLDALWRAPGGRLTARARQWGAGCGFPRHIAWSDAGFLGDELPSEQFPNDMLLKRALAKIKDGDTMVMHLGIWSRKDPFAPMLDPLIAGLKQRGLCFATLVAQK